MVSQPIWLPVIAAIFKADKNGRRFDSCPYLLSLCLLNEVINEAG